jgi:hypothetical protein
VGVLARDFEFDVPLGRAASRGSDGTDPHQLPGAHHRQHPATEPDHRQGGPGGTGVAGRIGIDARQIVGTTSPTAILGSAPRFPVEVDVVQLDNNTIRAYNRSDVPLDLMLVSVP